MSVPAELVLQEVTALYRFIESIVGMCSDLRDDYPVYARPSKDFFRHIQTLGAETLEFLDAFPKDILKNPGTQTSKRQKLHTLKAAWEDLHEYVRPALDADSLHLPTALITALHERLHEFEQWKDYQFTLFHSAEANYFEIPASGVRTTANDIADLVDGTRFPPSLGLIGIPYSQGDSCFLNCILAHEIGHFVYQEDPSVEFDDELTEVVQRLVDEVGGMKEEDVAFCTDLLRCWTEEIFCDLFAVFLIGPAYSFALSHLLGASFLVGRRDGEPADFYSFSQSHPASVSRLQQHQKLLNSLGWWPLIESWQSAPVQVLKMCEAGSALYTVESSEMPQQITPDRFLICHDEMCGYLLSYFSSLPSNISAYLEVFAKQSRTISEYLRRAVVPSTIIVDGRYDCPSQLVLLNAGFQFVLEDFRLLFDNLRGEDPESVKSRGKLMQRVELWVLKALEDSRLLVNQAK